MLGTMQLQEFCQLCIIDILVIVAALTDNLEPLHANRVHLN